MFVVDPGKHNRAVVLPPCLVGKDHLGPHVAATQDLPQTNAFGKTPVRHWGPMGAVRT